MKRYQVYLFGSELSSRIIGLEDEYLHQIDGDNCCLIGTSVIITRKGFYYCDTFFKKQFVSWSSLKSLD